MPRQNKNTTQNEKNNFRYTQQHTHHYPLVCTKNKHYCQQSDYL